MTLDEGHVDRNWCYKHNCELEHRVVWERHSGGEDEIYLPYEEIICPGCEYDYQMEYGFDNEEVC